MFVLSNFISLRTSPLKWFTKCKISCWSGRTKQRMHLYCNLSPSTLPCSFAALVSAYAFQVQVVANAAQNWNFETHLQFTGDHVIYANGWQIKALKCSTSLISLADSIDSCQIVFAVTCNFRDI